MICLHTTSKGEFFFFFFFHRILKKQSLDPNTISAKKGSTLFHKMFYSVQFKSTLLSGSLLTICHSQRLFLLPCPFDLDLTFDLKALRVGLHLQSLHHHRLFDFIPSSYFNISSSSFFSSVGFFCFFF